MNQEPLLPDFIPYTPPLARVVFTYVGGAEYSYQSDRPILLRFSASENRVWASVDGHEYDHEWSLLASLSSDGEVRLSD